MKTLRFPAGLYGITPEWDDTDRLLAAVRAAAAGGMTALQLRRKLADERLRAAQARALAPLCRELGVSCYNDLRRADALLAAGADYVAFGTVFASPT
ncbi:thiamine phosphate synthase, partial [Bordetella pertussis]|uniref:thiamine phosphate synthase n=1 Tax=Bordetella pertussis TaxID=520 RepID=UPI0018A78530